MMTAVMPRPPRSLPDDSSSEVVGTVVAVLGACDMGVDWISVAVTGVDVGAGTGEVAGELLDVEIGSGVREPLFFLSKDSILLIL